MPSAAEKQRRKELTQLTKAATAASFMASLPASISQFKALFDYLDDKLSEQSCDDTLRYTRQFAIAAQVPYETLQEWLTTEGGHCDCEVLANVEEKFAGLL
ncbi:MAG: DUF2695 domain-containing protein [Hymenobacter sp.]|nr:MAG: DUF2695 domain-containing protein [Hymenobacter sp.]